MSPVVEEIRLSLPHIELAAHIFGPEDCLPVIALHGWLDNANSFARLAPKLAEAITGAGPSSGSSSLCQPMLSLPSR